MALSRFLLGTALPLLLFSCTGTLHPEAADLGVSYGMVANNLPNPKSVVQLLQHNGITMVRIYDTDEHVLTALADTGIKVMVMLPNKNLADAARDPSSALQWVQSHVAPYYPATRIHAVAVGNEVFDSDKAKELTPLLVQAMVNVQAALKQLGLADAMKVSTPIALTVLKSSNPPSTGKFRDDLAESVMKPMLEFLHQTGSYLTMSIYPFWAYDDEPGNISRDYALGNSNPGVVDHNTGLTYYSLLDAERDATYFASENLGYRNLKVHLTETGYPSSGKVHRGKPPRHSARRLVTGNNAGAAAACPASVANAQAYNNNVINRVRSGNIGTPHRPHADTDVYIFALFNENQKSNIPDDVELNFGLFYPNMTKVYDFDFCRRSTGVVGATASWCVANAAVGDARMKAALDYACSNGADCSNIQRGAACFDPNTMAAHASHAVNSYYQHKNQASGTCDFAGAASVVYKAPTYGNCVLPSKA